LLSSCVDIDCHGHSRIATPRMVVHDACCCGALGGAFALWGLQKVENGICSAVEKVLGKWCWHLLEEQPWTVPILVKLGLLSKDKFPQSLGPFVLEEIPVEDVPVIHEFTRDAESWPFEVVNLPLHVELHDYDSSTVEVPLSPWFELKLNSKHKGRCGIPINTKYCRFAYPVMLDHGSFEVHDHSNDDANLMKAFFDTGGFAYYDVDGKITTLTTFHGAQTGNGRCLMFGEPKRWDRKWAKQELEHRFFPVTLHHLHQYGAEHFCWLKPEDEALQSVAEDVRPVTPHGAFVYLFRNSSMDRYFEVIRVSPFRVDHGRRHVQKDFKLRQLSFRQAT